MKFIILAIALFSSTVFALDKSINDSERFYKKQYLGFTSYLDCQRHGAIAFEFTLSKDDGYAKRQGHSFSIDDTVPVQCQPSSTHTFRSGIKGEDYDRGHLVSANQMDESSDIMADTFNMTNILPQHKRLNRKGGAWFSTEQLTECYREKSKITVWGGVIWGSFVDNDYFVNSHNIETPDYFWKIIYREDTNESIGFIFPNTKDGTHQNIWRFIKSVDEIISFLDFVPPSLLKYQAKPSSLSNEAPDYLWEMGAQCLSRRVQS